MKAVAGAAEPASQGAVVIDTALAIFAQVLLGALWGIIGILVAMPLAAVLLVLVQVNGPSW
jgi:predicted PurR-regulated permease PerM